MIDVFPNLERDKGRVLNCTVLKFNKQIPHMELLRNDIRVLARYLLALNWEIPQDTCVGYR